MSIQSARETDTTLQGTLNSLVLLQQANLDLLRLTNATLVAILMALQASSTGAYFDRDDAISAELTN